MTKLAFQGQMGRLVGLKFAPMSLDTHWEALRDLSDDDLKAAIARAARECEEYPSPKMLRAFALIAAPRVGLDEDRSTELDEPSVIPFPQAGRDLSITREWRYYCETCRDGGWESWHCGGNGACGRDRCLYVHEYVKHCACWDSNPALLKKRERQAQQAHTRAAGREH